MTIHLEIKNVCHGSFPKSLEFPKIFFSMQIEAMEISGIIQENVELSITHVLIYIKHMIS